MTSLVLGRNSLTCHVSIGLVALFLYRSKDKTPNGLINMRAGVEGGRSAGVWLFFLSLTHC